MYLAETQVDVNISEMTLRPTDGRTYFARLRAEKQIVITAITKLIDTDDETNPDSNILYQLNKYYVRGFIYSHIAGGWRMNGILKMPSYDTENRPRTRKHSGIPYIYIYIPC